MMGSDGRGKQKRLTGVSLAGLLTGFGRVCFRSREIFTQAGKQGAPFPERFRPPAFSPRFFAGWPQGVGPGGTLHSLPLAGLFLLYLAGYPVEWSLAMEALVKNYLSLDDLTTDLLRAPHRTSKRQASSSPCLLKTCVV